MKRELKFKFVWKHLDALATGIYTLEEVQKGWATPPKSRVVGGRMKEWDLVSTSQYTGMKDEVGKEIYEGATVVDSDTDYEGGFSSGEVEFTDCGRWLVRNGRDYEDLCEFNPIVVGGRV